METDDWLEDLLYSLQVVLKMYPVYVFLKKILEYNNLDRGVAYGIFLNWDMKSIETHSINILLDALLKRNKGS